MSKIYTLILDYMQSHRLPRLEFIRAEAMVVQKGWKTGKNPPLPPSLLGDTKSPFVPLGFHQSGGHGGTEGVEDR